MEGDRQGSHSHSIYSGQELSGQPRDRHEWKATNLWALQGHPETITASLVQSSGEERAQRRGNSQDYGFPSATVRAGCWLLSPVIETPLPRGSVKLCPGSRVPGRQLALPSVASPVASVCICETATKRKPRLCSQEAPHLWDSRPTQDPSALS